MRRAVVTFLAFVLIGTAINILVAWWCVLTWAPRQNLEKSHGWRPSENERAVYTLSEALGQELEYWNFGVVTPDFECHEGSHQLSAGLPMRSMMWHGRDSVMLRNSFGWMWREPNEAGMPRHTPPEWVILNFGNPTGYETLPTKPIWTGFVYNSLLYGTIAYLIVLGLRTRRRIIWRKSRRCVMCGYPYGSADVCTECGSPIATR